MQKNPQQALAIEIGDEASKNKPGALLLSEPVKAAYAVLCIVTRN